MVYSVRLRYYFIVVVVVAVVVSAVAAVVVNYMGLQQSRAGHACMHTGVDLSKIFGETKLFGGNKWVMNYFYNVS